MEKSCPFCILPKERIIHENRLGLVVFDAYPLSEGHSLIIPKRHIGSFFEIDSQERIDLLCLLDSTRNQLSYRFKPAGFNIGINDGPAAGQTVPHLHIHLIPRYDGDLDDPRGGVRWVIPAKAKYWS
jgi:diadenosine tetraphosphate (Ap4A) HIT family hydrolase